MKMTYTFTLAAILGFVAGGATIHGLNAQTKPPVFSITEIDVTDQEGYLKDYAPKATAALEAAGGKYLARGGKTYSFVGDQPKRMVVLQWENIDKFQAYRDSNAAKELAPILQKYGKFQRSFAVEGLSR